ncbi:MAG TPA: hypothetical protein PK514_09895 [Spirochaetota bacterium]|nr:hypothetical protein [Spirochaetota bacterium]
MINLTVSIMLIVLCAALFVKFSRNKNMVFFLILILAAILCGLVTGYTLPGLVNVIKRGFAETAAGMGLIIITGHLYAMLLYRIGVLDSVAVLITRIGKGKHSTFALAATGGIVSIPVTCEAGYSMLSPLGRRVAQKSGTAPAAAAISLSCGMYITNLLVLPTPGPIAAAGIMNANMWLLFVLGLAVSIPGIIAADYFSRKYAVKFKLETLTESLDINEPDIPSLKSGTALLFVSLPLLLILFRGIASLPVHPFCSGVIQRIIYFTGEPFIAILISAGVIILYAKRKKNLFNVSDITADSLKQSAQVLLVAAASGAFAAVFRTTGIMYAIPVSLPPWIGLIIPFIAAVLFKLLHGNSTAAMISASSITFASMYSMRISPELAVLAAGAGAMVVSHANDPFFWIVAKFSGMNMSATYRLFTVATLVSGLVTFLAVFVLGLFM